MWRLISSFSPLALVPKRISDGDLNKLVDTARFSQKYGLESFRCWATETISAVVRRNNSNALRRCSPDLYLSLLHLNASHRIPAVEERVTSVWLSRLRLRDPDVSFGAALDAGEQLHLRPFLGQVYYEQLKALNASAGKGVSVAPTGFDLHRLSGIHNVRLLIGHRSLSLCWDRIAGNIPPLSKPLCDAARNCHCEAKWRRVWNTALQATLTEAAQTDILTKLGALERHLHPARASACRAVAHAALISVQEIEEALLDSLHEHFMGPTEGHAAAGG